MYIPVGPIEFLKKGLVRIDLIKAWWNSGIQPFDPEGLALQKDLIAVTPSYDPKVLPPMHLAAFGLNLWYKPM